MACDKQMNMTQGSGGENYSDGVENSRRLFLIEMTVLAALSDAVTSRCVPPRVPPQKEALRPQKWARSIP